LDKQSWANPGVEQVTPTVFRIPLPLPDNPLRAVNVYAVRGAEGVGLIDGGWFTPDARAELFGALGDIGASPSDVDSILTTHYHPDHYTLAVALRRELGCAVALGIGERDSVDAIVSGDHGQADFAALLLRSGAPPDLVERHLRSGTQGAIYDWPTEWLADGDRRTAGGRELEVVATPGHTRGHLCFADDDAGLLFAGDHVLPHITPSISFETVADHLPLAEYLNSLRIVRERPDALLLPAHGPVAPSVHARAGELLEHHADRLRRCAGAVADGARTAFEVAQRIPWTSRGRRFTELSPFDQLMAVHETRAHLAVLEAEDAITVGSGGLVDEYAVA
jgi:glyoxylase-like metal-dependent hydrolase (beta-lactamase superfamily II)